MKEKEGNQISRFVEENEMHSFIPLPSSINVFVSAVINKEKE